MNWKDTLRLEITPTVLGEKSKVNWLLAITDINASMIVRKEEL